MHREINQVYCSFVNLNEGRLIEAPGKISSALTSELVECFVKGARWKRDARRPPPILHTKGFDSIGDC